MLIGIEDEETMLFGVHFQVLSAKKWELRACQLPHCIIAGDLQFVGILVLDNRDHTVLSGLWLQVFRSFAFVIL